MFLFCFVLFRGTMSCNHSKLLVGKAFSEESPKKVATSVKPLLQKARLSTLSSPASVKPFLVGASGPGCLLTTRLHTRAHTSSCIRLGCPRTSKVSEQPASQFSANFVLNFHRSTTRPSRRGHQSLEYPEKLIDESLS